jgi:hypothetical protein
MSRPDAGAVLGSSEMTVWLGELRATSSLSCSSRSTHDVAKENMLSIQGGSIATGFLYASPDISHALWLATHKQPPL